MNIDINALIRADINRRDWKGVHVRSERRQPFMLGEARRRVRGGKSIVVRLARTHARILHDIDPNVVAEHAARMEAWAERIGTPGRCKTGEVHPATGECLHCGAANGQSCQLGFGG